MYVYVDGCIDMSLINRSVVDGEILLFGTFEKELPTMALETEASGAVEATIGCSSCLNVVGISRSNRSLISPVVVVEAINGIACCFRWLSASRACVSVTLSQ